MIYMLELSQPVGSEKHSARHYIGYTDDVVSRLNQHLSGCGAKMIRHAVINLGLGVRLVGVIEGDRSLERKLKNRKNNSRLVGIFENKNEKYKNYKDKYYKYGDVLP